MKLLTFEINDSERLGALDDDVVVDLSMSGDPALGSMQDLIEAGEAGLSMVRDIVASASAVRYRADAVTWLAPLPRPIQMRDCLSFEEHLKNSFASALKLQAMQYDDPAEATKMLKASGKFEVPEIWYKQPIYYKANRFAVAASGTTVHWPEYSDIMDFELEMACVIGRSGVNISQEQADDFIFGYTIFNDFSARDAQVAEQQGMLGPAKGKDFDNSNILGPVIVTKDEIKDPYDLTMTARINGELLCDASSSTMHWKFPDMIEHISKGETLHAGEVIGSGTVGWGCGLEHLKFLNDGDEVELEIESIGKISNRVVKQKG